MEGGMGRMFSLYKAAAPPLTPLAMVQATLLYLKPLSLRS